jgi:hypothetical protein
MSERYAWDRAFRTLVGAVPGTYAMETLLQEARTRSTGSWSASPRSMPGAWGSPAGRRPPRGRRRAASPRRRRPSARALLGERADAVLGPRRARRGLRVGRPSRQGAPLPRALMEGIAFEQRLAFEGVEEGLGQPIDVLLTTGGIAQRPVPPDPRRCDAQDGRRLPRGRDDQPGRWHPRRRRRRGLAWLSAGGGRCDDRERRAPHPRRGGGGALRRSVRDLSGDLPAHGCASRALQRVLER